MRPLAIDLYCGLDLSEAEFLLRAYAAIKQLVTGRTKNPDHMRLRIGGESPSTITFVRRAMSDLQYPSLSARLTGTRHIRPSPREPVERHVLEISLLLIERATLLVFACRPKAAKLARRLVGASRRAISLVRVGRRDVKVLAAFFAIASVLRRALVFVPPYSSSPLRTLIAAPLCIGPSGLEAAPA
jgi:hypothetical protein